MILTLNLGIIALIFLSEAFNRQQLLAGIEAVSAPLVSGNNVTRLISLGLPGGAGRSYNKETALVVSVTDGLRVNDAKWSYYRTGWRHARTVRK